MTLVWQQNKLVRLWINLNLGNLSLHQPTSLNLFGFNRQLIPNERFKDHPVEKKNYRGLRFQYLTLMGVATTFAIVLRSTPLTLDDGVQDLQRHAGHHSRRTRRRDGQLRSTESRDSGRKSFPAKW